MANEVPAWRSALSWAVESPAAACLSVFITLWALVGDYIRILTVDAQHDALFLPGTVACIAWFTIEVGAVALPVSC